MSHWAADAACSGHDPRLWDIDYPHLWADGSAICEGCPIRLPCIRKHRGNRDAFGVYGGVPIEAGEPTDLRPARLKRKSWQWSCTTCSETGQAGSMADAETERVMHYYYQHVKDMDS